MNFLTSLIFAVSLCADCFAVSLCSSTSLKKIDVPSLVKIMVSFAVIQAGFLMVGWAFGWALVGLVERISHIIGFLLLLYVGGSMLLEGIRGEAESKDLNGWRNIVIGGIATSIDALAVGISLSMDNLGFADLWMLFLFVFIVTALSVVAGITGGKKLGEKFGSWAEIAGGIVLLIIGVTILI